MTEMVELTWRPREKDGKLGEATTFEVEKREAARMKALSERIVAMPVGAPERKVLISELTFFMDLYALFPGTELVEVPKGLGETEAIASMAAAEANGFRAPAAVRDQLSRGQLVLTSESETPSILDAAAGAEAREQAIGQVSAAADPSWTVKAKTAFRDVALRRPELTTDPVWELLARRSVDPPRERRAMATVVRAAQADGWVEKTDRFEASALPWAHSRNTQVWKSLIYQREAATG